MTLQATTIHPPRPYNAACFWIGGLVLLANKVRHTVQGYTRPRGFPVSQFGRTIEYDFRVVQGWLQALEEYTGTPEMLRGKEILELGPGPDLGVGLITLMKGAARYNALDVHYLIASAPPQFYEVLFRRMAEMNEGTDVGFLRSQLRLMEAGKGDRLRYVCDARFDPRVFPRSSIDLVFGHAAFEHFPNLEVTLSQLGEVTRRGAILVSVIDLTTHTRWIRDADPLNIYRYSDTFYRLCRFSGSPNRVRPFEYESILTRNGWHRIKVFPLTVVEQRYLSLVKPTLLTRFRDPICRMEYLGIVLCATRQ